MLNTACIGVLCANLFLCMRCECAKTAAAYVHTLPRCSAQCATRPTQFSFPAAVSQLHGMPCFPNFSLNLEAEAALLRGTVHRLAQHSAVLSWHRLYVTNAT